MGRKSFWRWQAVLLATACFLSACPVFALNIKRLEPSEIETLQSIMQTLEPMINAKKKDGSANILQWEKLYQPLSAKERDFINALHRLKAVDLGATSHYFGESAHDIELTPVGHQEVIKNGLPTPLDPQYLPRNVLKAYEHMMKIMKRDLGKRLLVESGYRSGAYQLYLFMYFMPKHDYSIIETNRFVALPGHSEHGYPNRQAIDFINEEGINGEDNPDEFEALPEYKWLLKNAEGFGFFLSYPRDNPFHTSFEPWHWHYEGN